MNRFCGRALALGLAMLAIGCAEDTPELAPCELFGSPCIFDVQDCYMITADNPGEDLVSGDAFCLNEGLLQEGELCSRLNDCGAGLGCILGQTAEADAALMCAQYCDLDPERGGPQCRSGFQCEQINQTYGNTPGVPDDVGFCVPDGWKPGPATDTR